LLSFALLASALLANGQSDGLSLAHLQALVSDHDRTIQTFRIEGVVCAVVPERKLLALQDSSATILLEVPALEPELRVGQHVAIEGTNCRLSENRCAIRLNTAPVVDNDGNHPAVLRSGSVWLSKGLQPFRVEWFNGYGPSALKVEYQGPGISRRKVPVSAYWHTRKEPAEAETPSGAGQGPAKAGTPNKAGPAKAGTPNKAGPAKAGTPSGSPVGGTPSDGLERGLHFGAYVADSWPSLPDFTQMKPVAEGIAEDVDLKHRAREQYTGLVLSGYLEILTTGIYTFHLTSDDGSHLFVGDPTGDVKMTVLKKESTPDIGKVEDALTAPNAAKWTELEGEVTFAGHDSSGVQLEILSHGDRFRATIVSEPGTPLPELAHRQVRATGVCRVERDVEQRKSPLLILPTPKHLELLDLERNASPRELGPRIALNTAGQVRRLKPDEARLGLHAKITGVVIWAVANAVVVQDGTGGLFIYVTATGARNQPRVGELWELSGTTAPGDFSPVIHSTSAKFLGNAAMPEPIRPTWDQLMNGSLDALYVEIRGVLTASSDSEMTLLTPGGKLRIKGTTYRPLPRLPALAQGPDGVARVTPIDSVVRVRGCFTADWDSKTKQVTAGAIFMGAPMIDVEETALLDPFAIPTRTTADLLHFDARASALQRTKVAGQIIYAHPREYCVLEGRAGMRFLTREVLPLCVGDEVEGVGFPQLGGPSPVLHEAQVRKTGHARLPKPVAVSPADLLDRNLDSTLVQIEAVLVGEAESRGERLLELQSGPSHFRARLKRGPGSSKTFSPGSRLQLWGVYSSARGEPADDSLDPFELLLTDASAITVLQTPPWWTLSKAITIVAILAGGLGLALVWITLLRRQVEERTAQLQRQIEERQLVEQRRAMEQERTRVAQDLHDELGAGLTEVGLLGSLAKNPSVSTDERERYLNQLTEAARSLVTGLDEIVWAVNPQYDSVASLASYYSLFAQRFLNLAGIACRLEIAEQFPEHPLDAKMRHGIFLAFKEALNNVVRHAEATEVGLAINVEDGQLRIAVSDNGRGLESIPQGPGKDGLAGMRDRIAKLGGRCEINSHPGRGTTVEFRLPLRSVHVQT
jgi:signal transduction histidine kinase